MVALHDQRQRLDASIIFNLGAVQHRAANVDMVNLYHVVSKHVCLQAGHGVQLALVADRHAVEFRDIGLVQVDVAADAAAEHGRVDAVRDVRLSS